MKLISTVFCAAALLGSSPPVTAQDAYEPPQDPRFYLTPHVGTFVWPQYGLVAGVSVGLRSRVEPVVTVEQLTSGDFSKTLVDFVLLRRSKSILGGLGVAVAWQDRAVMGVARVGFESDWGAGLDLRGFYGSDSYVTLSVRPFALRF